MKALLALFVIAAGMLPPVQAGINAELRRHLGHPLLAGAVNFAAGFLAICLLALALRLPLPATADLGRAPGWAWLGGLCGATLVVTSIVAAPRLGALLMIGCLVVGQLTASTLVDHFGWVGYPVRPASAMRLAGIALLVAGLILVERSTAAASV